MERSQKKLKIWIAIGTPFQANLFQPLIDAFKDKVDLLVTARDHDRIPDILEAKGVEYKVVGKHGGRELSDKLDAYARCVSEFIPLIRAEKPDLMVTERWPEAARVAFGLNIPFWSIFYDEREFHTNRMVFPLSSKVFAPRFYTQEELHTQGVLDASSVVWFKGFHTTYLKSCLPPKNDPFEAAGVSHPVVLVRTEPRFASFFPDDKPVLEETLKMLVSSPEYRKGKFNVLAIPRDEHQRERLRRAGVSIFSSATPENPIFFADVVLGAAETMLMEAFVLCKPCVSAIYWDESKPVKELHKYVPHSTNPRNLCSETLRLLNPEDAESFKKRARRVVDLMDNMVKKMVGEINILLGVEARAKKYRRRRSELDLCMELIEAISFNPSKLTPLMFDLGISHNKLRALIKTLASKGLVTEVVKNGSTYYRATEYGVNLLSDYKKLRDVLE